MPSTKTESSSETSGYNSENPESYPDHYIIGLTGGIGSGKTTVTDLFAELGIDVIDADVIARELLSKGSPQLNTVIQHFGKQYLTTSNELNRPLLGKTIFADKQEKIWLESLLHPLVRAEITALIVQSTSPYLIISAPLLLESGHYNFIDRMLVIDLPPELQISRTAARDNSSEEEVKQTLLAQMDREQRLSHADDIILNTTSIAQLTIRVKELHEDYRQQSQLKH